MHILTCENPQRIYNKYIGDYVWTRCNKCASCRNARAARWTSRIERERTYHRFSFFVTLTYSNEHLPVLALPYFDNKYVFDKPVPLELKATKDDFSISYDNLYKNYCDDEKEQILLKGFLNWIGLPYASSNDLQLFHKRLNKYIHDNYSQKYNNFRYFVCSEYGSTTLRPHFHGIYFVDDSKVAERFEECVLHSWQQGRVDCQHVEKSAGAYVAQYVNKSESLPKFYTSGEIRQRFYFSKFPTIGTLSESESEVHEVFSNLSVQRVDRKGANSNQVVLRANDSAFENRLFPKCFQFKSLSDSCRIKLYTIICRFPAQGPAEFCELVRSYLNNCKFVQKVCPTVTKEYQVYETSDYFSLLRSQLGDLSCLSSEAITWLRRVYYVSKRFVFNCKRFGISVFDYFQRIKDYWNKKELFLLRQFYEWQSNYVQQTNDSDSLVMMYPEFSYLNFGRGWYKQLADNFECEDVRVMLADAAHYSVSNRLTHFKNAYLDFKSLSDNKPIYKQIKSYMYAKKCNEID